jgi:hypothetical protein
MDAGNGWIDRETGSTEFSAGAAGRKTEGGKDATGSRCRANQVRRSC